MSFKFKNLPWIPFKQRTKSITKDNFTPKGYTSIAFTRDTTAAALACAEVLSHPYLDKTLIDKLLLNGLAKNIDKQNKASGDILNQVTAQQLLLDAKQFLHLFYQQCKIENSDFKDITDAANAECDIEFLQLVTSLFTREYVNKTYAVSS